MNIKKGDKVIVTTGASKGKSGSIVKMFPKKSLVLIDGVNVKKVHVRPRKQGEKGKILEQATPIHISNIKKA
jgi:large subunit ribosomal protein L24